MNEVAEDTRLGTVLQFLDEIEFGHQAPVTWEDDKGREIFTVDLYTTLGNSRFRVQIYGEEQRNLLLFYCFFYVNIPPRKRQEMAEFLTRMNYDLCEGNFEMDFRDGEVRYKTCLLYDGVPLCFDNLRSHFDFCLSMMNRHAPSVESIIISEHTAEKAAELAKQPPQPAS